MRVPKKHYLLLLVLQAVISIYCFNEYFNIDNYPLFENSYDALKNYFTLITYIGQPVEYGYLKYQQMNYPFGDFIWYTDNTPPIAMVLRWVHLNITTIDHIAIPVFHWTILFSILITPLILFGIFNELKVNVWIGFLSAIFLTWTNPQLIRLVAHLNFSYIHFIPLTIFLMLKIWKRKNLFNRQSVILISLLLLNLIIASFIHLYYLPIIGVFIGAAFFIKSILNHENTFDIKTLLLGFLTVLVPLIVVFTTIRFTDDYFSLRPDKAQGYDWHVWRIEMVDLFTSYPFYHLSVFPKNLSWSFEKYGFLTHTLIVVVVILIAFGFRNKIDFRKILKQPASILIIGSLGCLFIALGKYLYIPFTEIRILNIFNTFNILAIFSNSVEHFRCLGRFYWPFFFTFGITMTYILSKFKFKNRIYSIMLFTLLAIISITETYYFVRFYHTRYTKNNLTVSTLFPKQIQPEKYQAILPLPFFHVGNENYDITLDDKRIWIEKVFNASVSSGLPIMASKISRTPEEFTKLQYQFIENPAKPTALTKGLNSKPILVMYTEKEEYYYTKNKVFDRIYSATNQFINEQNLKLIHQNSDVSWYEYSPKN